MGLRTSDFHYDLPPELLASRPLPDRAASRMMVLHRDGGRVEHRMFRDLRNTFAPATCWSSTTPR